MSYPVSFNEKSTSLDNNVVNSVNNFIISDDGLSAKKYVILDFEDGNQKNLFLE